MSRRPASSPAGPELELEASPLPSRLSKPFLPTIFNTIKPHLMKIAEYFKIKLNRHTYEYSSNRY
jgi:hypothetical protein